MYPNKVQILVTIKHFSALCTLPKPLTISVLATLDNGQTLFVTDVGVYISVSNSLIIITVAVALSGAT